MKPDFDKMALSASALLYDETGAPMPVIVETRISDALRAAYAAGLERAAEIAAESGNVHRHVSSAIRAEKGADHG